MSEAGPPNILFILTDQHRLSAVGCYGETPCQTPHIDRLAARGVRFETAYTVCPVCSPARATVMTGLYPHAHGVCSNIHDLGSSVHELADRPELLSRQLQAAGYRCGYSGKWHLGTNSETAFGGRSTPSLPRDVGFEGQNFAGHGRGGFGYREYQIYLSRNGFEHRVRRVDDRPIPVIMYGILDGPVESTVPYYLTEHTIRMIDDFSTGGQPFFIWHNFWGPHIPYYSPLEFYDQYREVDIPEWPNYHWPAREINGPHQVKIHPQAEQLSWDDWAEGIRHYYAFTTLIDQQIGRMVNHLEETGLCENTIVVFAADHGETLGSHGGLYDKGWHHFEEIQRIPFIICLPEQFRQDGTPSGVLQEWVSLADVYPTFLEWAGVPCPADAIHGRSLCPLLQGKVGEWRDQAFVEFNGVNALATSMVTVRAGNVKYGWNGSNWDELYNLDDDPYEMRNLVREPSYRGVVREMLERIETWMDETDYPGLRLYRSSRVGKLTWPGMPQRQIVP
jgi:arylsulfatase A-like enzyme